MRNILYLLRIWIYLAPRSFSSLAMMIDFLNSRNLVGSKLERIFYRFRDLRNIERMGLMGEKSILELGTGSSTIFFLNLKKLTRLYSIEESREWLLHSLINYTNPKWNLSISKRESIKDVSLQGTKYSNKLPMDVNFVYVDGPSTVNSSSGFSLPNIDLGLPSNQVRENTVIAIDARISTTIFLAEIYKSSHTLFPSAIFINNYKRVSDPSSNEFQANFGWELTGQFSFRPTRTSLLIPNRLVYKHSTLG